MFAALPDAPALALLLVTAFLAGLARGFSGFGAALIFIPIASALTGPQVAAPLLLVVDSAMTLGLIPPAFRQADRREVLIMALGAFLGVPFGVWLLTTLDPVVLRWGLVTGAFALLALLLSGWRYHGRPKPPLTVLVGAVSGLFSGAAQMGGPPVVAYWLGGAIPRQTVRANIVLFFAISTLMSAVGYLMKGLFTPGLLALALATAAPYGFGVWLGSRMFGLASEQTFRRLCFAMIAIAGLLGMPALDGLLR